jgi:hypothetical protein
MNYILGGGSYQTKHNAMSIAKRPYNNAYTSSSKPMSTSIKKDPRIPETTANKPIYPSLQYYNNQNNSKSLISSVKEPRSDLIDRN